jgi:hypothetical protein
MLSAHTLEPYFFFLRCSIANRIKFTSEIERKTYMQQQFNQGTVVTLVQLQDVAAA